MINTRRENNSISDNMFFHTHPPNRHYTPVETSGCKLCAYTFFIRKRVPNQKGEREKKERKIAICLASLSEHTLDCHRLCQPLRSVGCSFWFCLNFKLNAVEISKVISCLCAHWVLRFCYVSTHSNTKSFFCCFCRVHAFFGRHHHYHHITYAGLSSIRHVY